MRFPDDTKEENINGAECERKQGNDEGSSLQLYEYIRHRCATWAPQRKTRRGGE